MVAFVLYRILYAVLFFIYLPKLLVDAWKKKSFSVVKSRLFPEKSLFEGLKVDNDTPVVWVHAVSLGETVAIAALIQELKNLFPSLICVTSHATQAGYDASKRLIPYADRTIYLPFEFFFSIRRLVSSLPKISLLIYSEGDIWPLFTSVARSKGARVCVVNGKLSDRSFSRYIRYPSISRFAFQGVDLFCLQSEKFKDLYTHLGIKEKKLIVTGNTKADIDIPLLSEPEKNQLLSKLCLTKEEKLIVLGSTHAPEEEILIQELQLIKDAAHMRIAVVPRHPHRFQEVYSLLQKHFPTKKVVLYSQLSDEHWDIVIIDAMGLLISMYQIAYVSVVCGSFVAHVGGHNILEPAFASSPVCVGPYMHSQQWLFDSALSQRAALRHSTPRRLARSIQRFITHPRLRDKMAERASQWARNCKGATSRTCQAIAPVLSSS